MKLILIPLSFLFVLAIVSAFFMDPSSTPQSFYSAGVLNDGFFASNGTRVCYANLTAVNSADTGHLQLKEGNILHEAGWYWISGSTTTRLYNTPYARDDLSTVNTEFDIGSTLSFLAIVGVIIAIGTIAGLKVLGSGISDISVSAIMIGGGLVTIWIFLTAIAAPFILEIPVVGVAFYAAISLTYTLGIINQISGTGDGL